MSDSGNTTSQTTVALTTTKDIPTANRVIEGIVLSVLIIVSVTGNLSLWIVVLRSRALRTLTSMFILGLSTADLLVATVNMPLTVYTLVMGEWKLGYNACVLAGFINMMTLICHGLPPIEVQGHLYSVFTLSTILSTPPLIGWSEYVYTPSHSFCFADWVNHMSYAFFMIGCCFGIPFSVMTVCNICIVRTVRNSRLRVKTNSQNVNSTEINDSYFRSSRQTSIRSDVSSVHEERQPAGFDSSSCKLSEIQHLKSKHLTYESIEKDISIIEINDEIHQRKIGKQTHETEIFDNFINDTNQYMTQESSEPMNDGEWMDVMENSFDKTIETDDKPFKTIPDKISTESMFEAKPPGCNSNDAVDKSNTSKTKSRNDQNTGSSVKDRSLLHPFWKSTVEQFLPHPRPRSISPEPSSDTSIKKRTSSSLSVNPPRPVSMSQTPPLRRREELRLALSLTVVVVVFVICWLPYCISMILSIFASGNIPREFHMFTLLIGYANGGCNPIIYGVMNKRFKIGFKRLFCFWRKSYDSSVSSA
ncbi:ACM3-like protein [Mya arenaria]|uniref:ACM3-like protein n=1 Tax=Mya arenaria TaxID=6604 RepID=A0ABY7F390_MYAAR|nr:ACM3-like protein [Mya arenaria]